MAETLNGSWIQRLTEQNEGNSVNYIALGDTSDYEAWNKFGYNDGLQNGVAETIWAQGGILDILTTAETLNIVSTGANDTDGGTGAHGVVVYGVDENWENVVEVVLLNGTTNVETTNAYFGINRIALFRSGTSLYNEGNITATATSAGTVQAVVPAQQGTTQQAFFFVSGNTTFLANWFFYNAVKTTGGVQPVIQIRGYVFSYVSNSKYEIYRDTIDVSRENHVELRPNTPFVVGEKSVLFFEATSDTNASAVRMRFSGIERTTTGQ